MDDGELEAWLRLLRTPGLGGAAMRRLLAAFGLPQHILEQDRASLARVVGTGIAEAVHTLDAAGLRDAKARTTGWLAAPDHRILTLADSEYPAALLQIADPPVLLYTAGRTALLRAPRLLAIVGTRNPSPQGARDARIFAHACAAAGITVVSGLAQGVDALAHQGALDALDADAGSGSTIAVLGTGCDQVYPATHRALTRRIAKGGLLVSEFALGTPPARDHFPRRNRIISGLARGVLVTEAALQSGSLITARLAAEQGRDVLAIPGSIHNPLARGCHRLLRDGARLVEGLDDILAELGWDGCRVPSGAAAASQLPTHAATAGGTPAQREVMQALGDAGADFDTLAARTGRDARWLAEQLLELELQGRVARMPGGRFQPIGLV